MIKEKLKTFYLTNQKYIDITFTLIVVAFCYAIHKGDLRTLVDTLNIAKSLLQILLMNGVGETV